ncbi:MAG: hypothetical protein DCC67_11670 [Planctomycetota bacterium]|nr:MAG: hypothetical protein DCC67_11670 [Planctomycetota bacterium]
MLTRRSAWNVYTAMLLVSLVALLAAALLLYLEIREYGGFGNVKGPTAQVQPSAAAAPALRWA